jgi:hypothetical protein
VFYIIDLGEDHMLLGMPFLAATNPDCYAPWLILCHASIFSFHLAHMCTTGPLIRLYRTTSAVAAYLNT